MLVHGMRFINFESVYPNIDKAIFLIEETKPVVVTAYQMRKVKSTMRNDLGSTGEAS